MKKDLFLAALAIVAFASCADDTYVGENNNSPNPNTGPEQAIVFNSGANAITRAEHIGSDAADLLNKQFVFAGTKTGSSSSLVFDQYYAKWVQNTASTTESNSNDWEYVGYTPASTTSLPSGAVQSIKYWDYSTSQYDFAAYSLGKGVGATPSYATATKIDLSKIGTDNGVYTLSGTADQLKSCYISDLITAYNVNDGTNNVHVNDYGKVVTFSFRSLAAKIRFAFYETVSGYSVKDLKFYTSSSAELATDGTESDPTLFSAAGLPSGDGTMTITFPTTGLDNSPHKDDATDYNKAHVTFSGETSPTLVLEDLANLAGAEGSEASGNYYLGRMSNNATYAGGLVGNSGKYYTILPNEGGANLQLRIKYTLVSTDGSAEEITVDNATAVVPAELAQWNPNYAYTYIFKISDMTNGTTGVDGNGDPVTGLTPITLNAVVVDSEDGVQETITTVSDPSITTYAEGVVVTANNEYILNVPIYIIVNNGTNNVELTSSNAKLYTVTLTAGQGAGTYASQTINEASVDNAIQNGKYSNTAQTYTVTDANKWDLVVTKSNLMSFVNSIAAEDSPTGNEITIGDNKVGKFTPAAAGTYYVFQYKVGTTTETYNSETAAAYNATLEGAIATTDQAYSFSSYADNQGSVLHGTGKVKVVSQENGWTTVLVTANSPVDTGAGNFVGLQFKVNATTLSTTEYYPLCNMDGTATGIYVKVETSTFDSNDVNNYNATLTGHVSPGEAMPKYQYKIIKIKED